MFNVFKTFCCQKKDDKPEFKLLELDTQSQTPALRVQVTLPDSAIHPAADFVYLSLLTQDLKNKQYSDKLALPKRMRDVKRDQVVPLHQ